MGLCLHDQVFMFPVGHIQLDLHAYIHVNASLRPARESIPSLHFLQLVNKSFDLQLLCSSCHSYLWYSTVFTRKSVILLTTWTIEAAAQRQITWAITFFGKRDCRNIFKIILCGFFSLCFIWSRIVRLLTVMSCLLCSLLWLWIAHLDKALPNQHFAVFTPC